MVILKQGILMKKLNTSLNMEEQTQDKKHIYTKKDIIALYSFFFVWSTGVVVILSVMCGVLPKHYIMFTFIQSSAYFMFHKLCNHCIVKNIPFFNEDRLSAGFDVDKRFNDDISCNDISSHSYRNEINLNSSCSTWRYLSSANNTRNDIY